MANKKSKRFFAIRAGVNAEERVEGAREDPRPGDLAALAGHRDGASYIFELSGVLARDNPLSFGGTMSALTFIF